MAEQKIVQAVILAGGRGVRLRPYTDCSPKPMYPIDGVPFIVRLIQQIKSFGIEDIVILLGYLSEIIVKELGDGKRFGINIIYDITPVEYDTDQRILHADRYLADRFLLMYCDNYCPITFSKLVADSYKNNAIVQLTAYSNKDRYTRDNLKISKGDNRIIVYDKSRTQEGLLGVDIGYAIVKKDVLNFISSGQGGFTEKVYPKLIEAEKLYATITDHRYYSVGSYDRLEMTKEFFKPKRVVFLDRDGTLNVRPSKACYVERAADFHWISGAIEAVRLLAEHNVTTILISNQPGIARGNLTHSDLKEIHEKMQKDLERVGAKIDYIYYCPHNWNDGCDCRKPKPGMLYQAQKDLALDLTKCVLFGDDQRDIEAGNVAGCKTVLVGETYPLLNAVKEYCREIEVSEP